MTSHRVAVVFGGRSVEHDVSIVTAHQVMAVLAESHSVVPVYVTREGRWLSSPELNDLDVYREARWDDVGEEAHIPPVPEVGGLVVKGGRLRRARVVPVDIVMPAIHGTYGEDGTLQGLLELADLPYVGSGVAASAVGMDKVAMKAAFRATGLPTVPHVIVETEHLASDPDGVVSAIETEIPYPVFVKPSRLGSSVGIGKAIDRDGLHEALDVARRYDRRLLVERAMDGCIEVNCSVLGGGGLQPRASMCEQPVSWQEFLTFSEKYMRGGKTDKAPEGMAGQERRIPAPISEALTKQVQDNAVAAFKAINAAGVARIDSFVEEASEKTWLMEINTTPGSFSFYLWEESGLSFSALVEELLDIALAAHRTRSELMFTFESGILEDKGGSKTSASGSGLEDGKMNDDRR